MPFKDHEFVQSDTNLRHCVPLIFHVDGAEVYRNSEYHVFSWRSAFASHDEVLDTQLYMMAVPESVMHRKQVKQRIHRVAAEYIAWNIRILQTGIGPQVGFYGEAFPPKSVAAGLANQPLSRDGWHAVFFGSGQQFCLGVGCQDIDSFWDRNESNRPRSRHLGGAVGRPVVRLTAKDPAGRVVMSRQSDGQTLMRREVGTEIISPVGSAMRSCTTTMPCVFATSVLLRDPSKTLTQICSTKTSDMTRHIK